MLDATVPDLQTGGAGAMETEYAFEMATSNVRFGPGVTREVGPELVDLGAKSAMVVTDRTVARLAPVATVLESLADAGVEAVLAASEQADELRLVQSQDGWAHPAPWPVRQVDRRS